MKKECEIFKYVYRKVPFRGGFWRYHKINDYLYSLREDFPAAAFVSQCSNSFTLKYKSLNDDITIWTDKHGNIIVRVLRTNNIQTKINF